jgi:hypothetical protein
MCKIPFIAIFVITGFFLCSPLWGIFERTFYTLEIVDPEEASNILNAQTVLPGFDQLKFSRMMMQQGWLTLGGFNSSGANNFSSKQLIDANTFQRNSQQQYEFSLSRSMVVNCAKIDFPVQWNFGAGNTVDIQIGQSLPGIGGRLFAGVYHGDDSFGMAKSVYIFGFDRGFLPALDENGKEYKKLVLAGDYSSGKNIAGTRHVGIHYYFNPDISILTGPVWFKDHNINGKPKWAFQVEVNFPFPIKTQRAP